MTLARAATEAARAAAWYPQAVGRSGCDPRGACARRRRFGLQRAGAAAYDASTTYTSWHTADLIWTAQSTEFLVDGTSIGTSTSAIPNTPMHWVLQTETSMNGVVPSDGAEGKVQIDWAVVYVPM